MLECEISYCEYNDNGACKWKKPDFKVISNMPLSNGNRVVCGNFKRYEP